MDTSLQVKFAAFYRYEDSLKAIRPLRETLVRMSPPAYLRTMHGNYLIGSFRLGRDSDYFGADMATRWWNRNLRIFNNTQRISTGPDDHILVIIGGGHVPLLRHNVESSPPVPSGGSRLPALFLPGRLNTGDNDGAAGYLVADGLTWCRCRLADAHQEVGVWGFVALLALAAVILGRFRLPFFAGALAVLIPSGLVGLIWLMGDNDRWGADVAAHGVAYAHARNADFFWAVLGVALLSFLAGAYTAYRVR